MPIQLDFILRRFVEVAEADAALRERQPWKAAYERDYGWLSAVLARHYAGDDSNLRVLAARVLAAHDDDKREFAYTTGADRALDQAAHDRWTVVSVKDDWATVF